MTFLQRNKVPPTADDLARVVMIAPGSQKPDAAFWAFVKEQSYSDASCLEPDACVLVSQDLNGDGQPEQVLYNFIVAESRVYGLKEGNGRRKRSPDCRTGFLRRNCCTRLPGIG